MLVAAQNQTRLCRRTRCKAQPIGPHTLCCDKEAQAIADGSASAYRHISSRSRVYADLLVLDHAPSWPNSNMASVSFSSVSSEVSCPRDGSRWYTCSSGSMFVGCCKHNPCKFGCEADYMGAALLTQDAFNKLPRASCSTGSTFYSCDLGNFNDTYRGNQTYYWGCCKSDACEMSPPGCRKGDLGMASMQYSSQLSKFLKVIDDAPPANFTGALANEAPVVLPTDPTPARVSQHNTKILISLCLAFFVILPILVGLWIGHRALLSKSTKRSSKDERLLTLHAQLSLAK